MDLVAPIGLAYVRNEAARRSAARVARDGAVGTGVERQRVGLAGVEPVLGRLAAVHAVVGARDARARVFRGRRRRARAAPFLFVGWRKVPPGPTGAAGVGDALVQPRRMACR